MYSTKFAIEGNCTCSSPCSANVHAAAPWDLVNIHIAIAGVNSACCCYSCMVGLNSVEVGKLQALAIYCIQKQLWVHGRAEQGQ